VAVRTSQAVRSRGDHPDQAKDGCRASYEGATEHSMFHVSLRIVVRDPRFNEERD
jgi:hypothetical protein